MKTEKIYAYFVYGVLVDPGLLELNNKYVPLVQANTIYLSKERDSFLDHEVVFADGPIKLIASLSFIGEGESTDGKLKFSEGVSRQMSIITAGVQAEQVMIQQIRAFSSKAQERVEEALSQTWSQDTTGNALRAIEELEREFIS